MNFLFTLPTAVLFLYSFSSQFAVSEADGCKRITSEVIPIPFCRPHGYVVVEHKKVYKNQFDVIIVLGEGLQRIPYFCEANDSTFDWTKTGKDGNQIRASYIADELILEVYWCDDLCGPKKPKACVYNTLGYACPGLDTSDHSCVYEVKETKESAKRTVDANEVEGTIAANVENLIAGVSMSKLRERTEIKIVKYSSKSYIVVPSGYIFCSYSEAKTVKNPFAPTGFEWQCYPPKFRQFKINEECTTLPLCFDVGCSNCKKRNESGRVISSFNVLMLILTAAVIVFCF